MSNYKQFKVNDLVRCVSSFNYHKDCKNKLGRIIYLHNNRHLPYLVEFFEPVNGHSGDGKGKAGYCFNIPKKELKLYKQPILKLFLKEKNNEITTINRG